MGIADRTDRKEEKEMRLMDMQENMKFVELRKSFQCICREFERFEQEFGWNEMLADSLDTSVHYANVFGGDILTYAFYLTAADGSLTAEESALIEGVLQQGLNQHFLSELIKNAGIVSEEDRKKYESSTIKSMCIAVVYDRFYKEKRKEDATGSLTEKVLTFFREFGKQLVEIDREKTSQEQQSIETLLAGLQKTSEEYAARIE